MPFIQTPCIQTMLIVATIATALSSCADPGSDLPDDQDAEQGASLADSQAAGDGSQDTGRDQDNQPDGRGRQSRSPQGIRDGADERRDQAREPRRDGQLAERVTLADIELRTFDGTNNNVSNPTWGATFSQLQRLGAANYSDGVSSMIHSDRAGAREISNTIVSQLRGETIPNQM